MSDMHRVVTKVMDTQNGIRKRYIDKGPWQPSKAMALRWADFLERTGRYDSVTIQSNGQGSHSDDAVKQSTAKDTFSNAGK
jgi:hypothetical protein